MCGGIVCHIFSPLLCSLKDVSQQCCHLGCWAQLCTAVGPLELAVCGMGQPAASTWAPAPDTISFVFSKSCSHRGFNSALLVLSSFH